MENAMSGGFRCPVCGSNAIRRGLRDYLDKTRVECDRCGKFEISEMAAAKVLSKRGIALISHALRRMQRQVEWPYLDTQVRKAILENSAVPKPKEQGDNLIEWMAWSVKDDHGKVVHVSLDQIVSEIGSISIESATQLLQHLNDEHLIEYIWQAPTGTRSASTARLRLKPKGWDRYDELDRGARNSRLAFMAMSFKNESVKMAYRQFQDAIKKTGFELHTIDDPPKAGDILNRMRVEILRSRFVVADLTDGNQGAYWEAGMADGLDKPVIYTCEKEYFEDPGTHFDTDHSHTVIWDKNDLASACEALKLTVRATLPSEAKLQDD